MTTLRQAADRIAQEARESGMRVQQIDPMLCEAGETIAFYVYGDDDACSFADMALPQGFAVEGEFLFREWRAALMRLLPADVISEHAWS